jgi:hypothetical protein
MSEWTIETCKTTAPLEILDTEGNGYCGHRARGANMRGLETHVQFCLTFDGCEGSIC